MTSRRQFLRNAAALSAAAPLAGRAAFADGRDAASGIGSAGIAGIDAVVFDSRHAAACEFGARAGMLGAPLRPIDGDVTDLWRSELRGRWKGSPAAVAGLTERPALFLLERLAWDHGLRVVFEAEHAPDAAGIAAHRVIRTADPQLARALGAAGVAWARILADALIAGGRAPARELRPTDAGLAARAGEPTVLRSWIIAPRSAASAREI